ncbi:thymidine kinase [Bacteriovoracaceae bacterium]|nr:thymidine kinase [Bacteriovoracaceae bacterium]
MAYSQYGSIEVVCGPMFSGKTEELIRRVKRAQIAKLRVQIFKPKIDDRYDANDVVSHSSQVVKAIPVQDSDELLGKVHDLTRVVGIDEVQFFDNKIVDIVNKLANRGFRVICAGLDLDFKGVPFGPMPELLAIADEVQKISAICTICGNAASRSHRLIQKEDADQVMVGELETYEARCRQHWFVEEIESKHFHRSGASFFN